MCPAKTCMPAFIGSQSLAHIRQTMVGLGHFWIYTVVWNTQGRGKYLGLSEKQSFLLPAYLSHPAICPKAKEKGLNYRSYWNTSLATEQSRFRRRICFITIFVNGWSSHMSYEQHWTLEPRKLAQFYWMEESSVETVLSIWGVFLWVSMPVCNI